MERLTFLDMLDLAMLAYSDTPTSNLFSKIHFESAKNGIQYYIGKNKETNQTIISFRGTDSMKDLKTDINFRRKEIPYDNVNPKIRVHGGFINAYKTDEVRDKIHFFIKTHNSNSNANPNQLPNANANANPPANNSIYITGHSYGAALALLCALDLQYSYPQNFYEVAVFGCPRIGNRPFVKSYNRRLVKTIRFENGNDLVTKIPFAILGFKNAGVKIHVGAPRLIGVYNLADHSTSAYYQALWDKFS